MTSSPDQRLTAAVLEPPATRAGQWEPYPPFHAQTPVLALCMAFDRLLAGGVGGTALWDGTGVRGSCTVSLRSGPVSALLAAEEWIFAGGVDGIFRSPDAGQSWSAAAVPVGTGMITALAASPAFERDGTALAATLEGGILRSDDRGARWRPATFGLQTLDIAGLAWGAGDSVLAATADGIYRSPNGGRAWRPFPETRAEPMAAVAVLPDGTALAATESGSLLRSSDGGTTWNRHPSPLPGPEPPTLLAVAGRSAVLGTTGGLWRSTDGGSSWRRLLDAPALSFLGRNDTLAAGTGDGVLVSRDGGETWSAPSSPPVQDLARLLIVQGTSLVAGVHTAPHRFDPDAGWVALAGAPHPLGAIAADTGGRLLASGPEGLLASDDAGATWRTIVPGPGGHVALLASGRDGVACGIAVNGAALLRTTDDWATWDRPGTPFAHLSVTGLHLAGDTLAALTHDVPRARTVLWHSADGGERWHPEPLATSIPARPVLATSARRPLAQPLLAVGGELFAGQSGGRWTRTVVGPGVVQRLAAEGTDLVAITTAGLRRSGDGGATWQDEFAPPDTMILDAVLEDGILYALASDGTVWRRPIHDHP